MVGTFTLPGVSAQDLEATIEIDSDKRTAAISGRFTGDGDGPRNLSFTGTAIGADRLSSRIDKVELSGGDGSPLTTSFRTAPRTAGGERRCGSLSRTAGR
ncbi:MAG: hypothetical protein IPM25_08355 [Chloracidobacterium sp.]|nr:hypothetical protein [Chloracidobacterium sp.]